MVEYVRSYGALGFPWSNLALSQSKYIYFIQFMEVTGTYGVSFVIIGFKARFSAGLLSIFCIATAFLFHYDFVDQMQTIAFLKNLGLAGGFLFIVANGTKDWSVDREKKYVRL